MASLSGPVHVAFDSLHGLRSCDVPITGLNHTPHATAAYASWPASPSAHATLASRLPAGHYLGRTFTTDRASFAWRLRRVGLQADSHGERRSRTSRRLASAASPTWVVFHRLRFETG